MIISADSRVQWKSLTWNTYIPPSNLRNKKNEVMSRPAEFYLIRSSTGDVKTNDSNGTGDLTTRSSGISGPPDPGPELQSLQKQLQCLQAQRADPGN
uniref:Uncharacterized protein n=1 Tax=Anguilla anguilla TaxID=7936 RepID=A0A0E9Y2K1_ANGAN